MGRNEWTNEKLFFRLINNKSDSGYWDNISVLRTRPIKEVFDRCIELTHSEIPKERVIGIDVLAQLGLSKRPFRAATNKRLFELLETEKKTPILASLLHAIGHNNSQLSKMQIEQLCSFADNNSSSIKWGLVWSLLGIDNPRAIDTLIKLSTYKQDHIRDWATFGLGSLIERDNKKIREALWGRVDDKDQDTRFEAITGLAIRKDIRVNEIIMRELLFKEYGTQLFEAILECGDKEFLPILKQHYKETKTDKEISDHWLSRLKETIAELSKQVKSKV